MPRIVDYRRTRHLEPEDLSRELRLQMQRNRVVFNIRYERDHYEYNEDDERNDMDGNVARHTEGFYSLDCTWDSEYDPETDHYVGLMHVSLMFESSADLESFEKHYVLLHKLSN